jgi:selenide,water dikinase
LGKLPKFTDPNLIVGIETSDDAAIYKINEEVAMIQTLDFFTPIVDDPYMFGAIAASNALSDVWAMGGEPKVALNIVGFPSCLDPEVLGEILRGGADKVKEAGAVLIGGHTIKNDEPQYGLSVSGFVHPEKIWTNAGANVGDVLILTKQIGTGVINTGMKADMSSEKSNKEAEIVMASLNKKAKEVASKYNITSCTDITGFGLLGHSIEMAEGSDLTFEIEADKVPMISDALSLANMGLVPAGTYKNRNYFSGKVDTGKCSENVLDVLFDPQTSGGLLLSLSEEEGKNLLKDLEQAGLDTEFALIGKVVDKDEKSIRLV